ncbi:hypothetical protein [Hyphomonas johnsonii]|uniref:Uncharacterized protein n=1 Tax=Hyphomonas johnsonii MHS-2 TaxID=1280950 RepID=A0A059FS41_9PROT|nr:hypothetical protein [Hyphomonas johnsonii]KCZ93480.1 hypothetical protein HJO_06485 [Hyphomonas johnsonii MHS-2]
MVSTLLTGRPRQVVFLTGWLPVVGLAVIASGFELTAGHVCPLAFAVLPQCYVSLILAILIGGTWASGLLHFGDP